MTSGPGQRNMWNFPSLAGATCHYVLLVRRDPGLSLPKGPEPPGHSSLGTIHPCYTVTAHSGSGADAAGSGLAANAKLVGPVTPIQDPLGAVGHQSTGNDQTEKNIFGPEALSGAIGKARDIVINHN